MTRELPSLGAMALEFLAIEVGMAAALEKSLERVLVKIERTAKSEFGTYQPEVGEFPGWNELAEATKADRVAKGYSENEPLLREGDLRDGIGHEREGLDGIVGSPDEIMIYHELGTSRMPPRPVLGPAAFRSKAAVEELLGVAFVTMLTGSSMLPAMADD